MSKIPLLCAGALLAIVSLQVDASPAARQQKTIERGRHLLGLGGCNDCHSPGWGEHGGQAPQDQLLTGGGLAFQGPWGTTYPVNLRLLVQKLTREQWINTLRNTKSRPMMPWWTFREMSDADLAAMYEYIHALGPAGQPEHAYVPPGRDAPAPYLKLVPPAGPPDAQH